MQSTPAGTKMKLDLIDTSNGSTGFAIYQKGMDGKWHHVESNVSGSGVPVPAEFKPSQDSKTKEFSLSPNHKDILVNRCEFSMSESMIDKMLRFEHRVGGKNYEMRVVRYQDGKVGMEVKIDGNYQPFRGNEAFVPPAGSDARKGFDDYLEHQKDLFQK
jgi:hypothetical protein